MPRVLERAVIGLVFEVAEVSLGETPGWLKRPGRAECGDRWSLVSAVYSDAGGVPALVARGSLRPRR